MVWNQHNDCISDGAQLSVSTRITTIKKEAVLWLRAGAHGVRVLLPMTWDVH
jgi:hypothetical protein